MKHKIEFDISLYWVMRDARKINWIISYLDYECYIHYGIWGYRITDGD